jgi:ankyrin repeat protein
LCLALAGGYTDIANLLLQHGTRVDPVSAVLLGRIDFLAKSIEQEPALLDRNYFRSSWSWIGPQGSGCGMYSAANAYEGTLLHYAVRASQYRVVQFLLESGAILTTKDLNGVSAFELAIKQDDSEMLGLFEARAAGDPRKVGESRRR